MNTYYNTNYEHLLLQRRTPRVHLIKWWINLPRLWKMKGKLDILLEIRTIPRIPLYLCPYPTNIQPFWRLLNNNLPNDFSLSLFFFYSRKGMESWFTIESNRPLMSNRGCVTHLDHLNFHILIKLLSSLCQILEIKRRTLYPLTGDNGVSLRP